MLQRQNELLGRIITVILCAGEGTRLKKMNKDVPKPLIKIKSFDNLPILHHIISNLVKLGLSQVIVVKGHLGNKIDEFISSLLRNNVNLKDVIQVIDSGNRYKLGPLHSFSSIAKNPELMKKGSIIFVLPGDTFFQFNLFTKILNQVINLSTKIEDTPIIFFRKILGSKLKELRGDESQIKSKFISVVEIEKIKTFAFLSLIKKCELKVLSEDSKINQIIPLFAFPKDFLSEIFDLKKFKTMTTITEAINNTIENGKKFLAIEIESNLEFYDFDEDDDFTNFVMKKKKRS